MTLTILPLDSRPCTYDMPRQLAEGCGVQVKQPSRDLMDFFRQPSSFEALHGWLLQHTACDVMVLSVDQLVYGGLLASRSMQVSETEALRRMEAIAATKQTAPQTDIWLFNVVMRTTVSTLKKEDQIWWKKVAAYSCVAEATTAEGQAQRKRLEVEIPPQVLETFLAARRRNHLVNLQAVRMVAQGVAEELVLLQEDSAPEGMHKTEQRALLELAQELGVAHRVHLHCGTDEVAAALVGKFVCAMHGGKAVLGIEWLGEEQPGFVPRYEDRQFTQNLASYLQTCGIMPASAQAAETVMLVYAPKTAQQDLAMEPDKALPSYTPAEMDGFCARVAALLEAGKQVALLDIHHANGGEGVLIRRLAAKGLLHRLHGYAGWNTACNSLGTLLGQLQCLPYATQSGNSAFTALRLLDDWLYQAVVRARLDNALVQIGEDRWAISDAQAAGRLLNDLMHAVPEMDALAPTLAGRAFKAGLVWPRTFECKITLEPDLQNRGEPV